MGLFITVNVDQAACLGIDPCGKCLPLCPVNIFAQKAQRPTIVAENEDECTLCDLCIAACEPKCILIVKEYASQ